MNLIISIDKNKLKDGKHEVFVSSDGWGNDNTVSVEVNNETICINDFDDEIDGDDIDWIVSRVLYNLLNCEWEIMESGESEE